MSKPRSTEGAPTGLPVLITMGEPAGVGPEVAVAAFHALGGRVGGRALKLVGDETVFQACGGIPQEALIATIATAGRHAGKPDARFAPAVIEAIALSAKAALAGQAAAVVTAPIHKAVLTQSGFGFPGHTEYLAHLTGAQHAVMLLASPALKVVPQTIHVPLRAVPELLTTEAIVQTALVMLEALKGDFGVAAPRLAIAGLNPHAGEDGTIGGEDRAIIAPAVALLREHGHDVRGPLSADTLFHDEARATYDAALCMYHDQALIPSKTLAFWDGVNVTLGLPIVRTSPDHGTAFDIAGTGKADMRSMIAAIQMAAEIADRREAARGG